MPRFSKVKPFIALGAIAFLAACAETQLATQVVKEATTDTSANVGHYKVGNPYQIQGVWYYPAEEWDYVETGIASWYGPNFHGKPTANGEIFDMNQVSAAHRTLQIPSIVRVTNLDNGRSLVVRVNDRGPFAHGRIIDMSRRGAQLLGFEREGTARVRVEIVRDQSLAIKRAMTDGLDPDESPIKVAKLPKEDVAAQSLDAPSGARAAPQPVSTAQPATPAVREATPAPANMGRSETVTNVAVNPTQVYVQAGAFSVYENANKVVARLSSLGDVKISQVLVNGRDFYRVRLGPVNDTGSADALLDQVIGAGYPGAKVIVVKNPGPTS